MRWALNPHTIFQKLGQKSIRGAQAYGRDENARLMIDVDDHRPERSTWQLRVTGSQTPVNFGEFWTFAFVLCFNLLKNTEWPVKVGTLCNTSVLFKKRELWLLTCHRNKRMDRRGQNRRGGFSSSYQRYSYNTQNRNGTKRCTLCKQDGHLKFECMKEIRFEDEEGNEWVKWTLTKKEYEMIKREREKDRVKKEMLIKKEKLKDEMRMKKEIEIEIAREKRERRRSRKLVESESDEEIEEMSDRKKGGTRSMTEDTGVTKRGLDEEDKLMKMLKGMMTKQEEMMRELEEVKGLRNMNGKTDKSKDKWKSVGRKNKRGVIEDENGEMGSEEVMNTKERQKGVMVKATYVPRAALDEDEYDEDEEVIGEVPIATEELCNGLNRAWLAREKMREKKKMGPVRQANVKRMVTRQAEAIDENVRLQAMINVVCAYGGEVMDDMGFEELVHELGVIYR